MYLESNVKHELPELDKMQKNAEFNTEKWYEITVIQTVCSVHWQCWGLWMGEAPIVLCPAVNRQ
jgi:hypothetical protein